MLKTIFWGNSDFVLPVLDILNKETELMAIFTGLDKPFGRNKNKLKIPEPKLFAEEHNIPCFQESDLKTGQVKENIEFLAPDLMVVVSYGKIIPESLFSLPPLGTINLHASLLPKYRGASPMQQSLLHGDKITGISIQKINEELDAGNLLYSEELNVEPNDTYPILKKKLSELSGKVTSAFLKLLKNSKIEEKPQIGEITHCTKIKKQDGKIHWAAETAPEIFNKWRAFYAWPGIYTYLNGKLLKLKEIQIENMDGNPGSPGEVVKADKRGFIVKAKSGFIRLDRVQPENKKEMDYLSFLNGHKMNTGELLG